MYDKTLCESLRSATHTHIMNPVQFDVFEVLCHVRTDIMNMFVPTWVQHELSSVSVNNPPPTGMKLVINAVENWLMATKGSELMKCTMNDTSTLKRIISHVKRNTMTTPCKILQRVFHSGILELDQAEYFVMIIGKDGEFIKKIQAGYPGFWMNLTGLILTVRSLSAESVEMILALINERIKLNCYVDSTNDENHKVIVGSNELHMQTARIREAKDQCLEMNQVEIARDILGPRKSRQYRCRQFIECKQYKVHRDSAKGKIQDLTEE